MKEPPDHIIPWIWPAADDDDGGPPDPGWLGGRKGGPEGPGLPVVVFASVTPRRGKTMLAAHLAVEAGRRGAGPVALLIANSWDWLQGWRKSRGADTPVCISTRGTTISKDLERCDEDGFRLAVVDADPAFRSDIAPMVTAADVLVVPFRAYDDNAAGIVELLGPFQQRPLFLSNAAELGKRIPGERVSRKSSTELSQLGTIAPLAIHWDEAFAEPMKRGLTVMETDPQGEAAKKIGRLWEYLAERLRLPASQ